MGLSTNTPDPSKVRVLGIVGVGAERGDVYCAQLGFYEAFWICEHLGAENPEVTREDFGDEAEALAWVRSKVGPAGVIAWQYEERGHGLAGVPTETPPGAYTPIPALQCPACKGTGRIKCALAAECSACKGSGRQGPPSDTEEVP